MNTALTLKWTRSRGQNHNKMKTVGIIGGMGPEATLDFITRIRRKSAVHKEQDHIHLLVDDNPKINDRNKAILGKGPSAGPEIATMAVRLERAGADFLVMPCNTAHAFSSYVTGSIHVPFVSIITETCNALSPLEVSKVGLLLADGCRAAGLYQEALRQRGIQVVLLDEEHQTELMALIYRIKEGDRNSDVAKSMRRLALLLQEEGAEALVAACTEIPLVLRSEDLDIPLVSSTDVLAQRTVELASDE